MANYKEIISHNLDVLSASIRRHGLEKLDHCTPGEKLVAQRTSERIARTFARFAEMDGRSADEFLKQCGFEIKE